MDALTRIYEASLRLLGAPCGQERSPRTLRRWLPTDYAGPEGRSAFRSSFTFVLNPASAESLWRSLVIEEVEPALVRLGVMSGAPQGGSRAYRA